jgi:Carboxypeptidase regulatory-like domain
MKNSARILLAVLTLFLGACSPKIYGTVRLLDANLQPIPPAKESPEGTVINMINITTTLERASLAVTTDEEGSFEFSGDYLIPGKYKVEASRIGYLTDTQSVEVTKHGGQEVDFRLRKIPESRRKSIEGSTSDENKIVNPGEVNIEPPAM